MLDNDLWNAAAIQTPIQHYQSLFKHTYGNQLVQVQPFRRTFSPSWRAGPDRPRGWNWSDLNWYYSRGTAPRQRTVGAIQRRTNYRSKIIKRRGSPPRANHLEAIRATHIFLTESTLVGNGIGGKKTVRFVSAARRKQSSQMWYMFSLMAGLYALNVPIKKSPHPSIGGGSLRNFPSIKALSHPPSGAGSPGKGVAFTQTRIILRKLMPHSYYFYFVDVLKAKTINCTFNGKRWAPKLGDTESVLDAQQQMEFIKFYSQKY